jgi:hypothetical protein
LWFRVSKAVIFFTASFVASDQDLPAHHFPAQKEKGRKIGGRKMILPSMILPYFWLSATPRYAEA